MLPEDLFQVSHESLSRVHDNIMIVDMEFVHQLLHLLVAKTNRNFRQISRLSAILAAKMNLILIGPLSVSSEEVFALS